jgi:hypothetical protein
VVSFLIHEDVDVDLVFQFLRIRIIEQPQVIGVGKQTAKTAACGTPVSSSGITLGPDGW